MRSIWLSKYLEVQRRAQYRMRLVNAEIQQQQNTVNNRIQSLATRTTYDLKQCKRQLGSFVSDYQKAWKQSSEVIRSFLLRGYHHVHNTRAYPNAYNKIIRNPTYQSVERWWSSSPCPATVVLLLTNTFIFLLWQISKPNQYDPIDHQVFNHGLISTQFLQRHFTTSVSAVKEWRFYTLLTSAFSHQDGKHFLYTIISTYFMGSSLEMLIGAPRLLALYVVAGVGASICQVVSEAARHRNRTQISGASGSLSAIMATLAIKAPLQTVLIYGIFPVPMVVLVVSFLAYDVLHTGGLDSVGHEAHIGGAVIGAVAAYLYRVL